MDAATVAPYIAAGVALVVGLVNPWATNRFAARRTREQLEHDRAMRQRDEIIALISEASSAGSTRFYVTDRARDLWRMGVAWDDPRTQEVDNERTAAVEKLRGIWGQVEVRLPEPMRDRFEEWRRELDGYSAIVRRSHREGRPAEESDEYVVWELRNRAGEAADRWLMAARAAIAASIAAIQSTITIPNRHRPVPGAPTMIRRTRLTAPRDVETGRLLDVERVNRAPTAFGAQLLAAGSSVRAAAIIVWMPRSTLHERVRRAG